MSRSETTISFALMAVEESDWVLETGYFGQRKVGRKNEYGEKRQRGNEAQFMEFTGDWCPLVPFLSHNSQHLTGMLMNAFLICYYLEFIIAADV